jgi:uracil-DNA glycosylase family 4
VEPFIGKSGQVLRRKLSAAGFDLTSIAFANTVSCRPTSVRTVGRRWVTKDRAPDHKEMDACRGNLFDQLDVLRCRFVLLCGGTSLRAFRPDLRLNAHHGRLFVWEQKWLVMPTYHPASIFHDKRAGKIIDDDIERMYWLSKGELDPSHLVSEWCMLCGEPAEFYDPNLAGYCHEHWHDKELSKKPQNRKRVQQAWWASTRDGQVGGKMKVKGTGMPVELFPDAR